MKTKNSWTIFGLSNFSYDILDAIESTGGQVTRFVSNVSVDTKILARIPAHIKQISLADFTPDDENYFIGFMDYHKDDLLRSLKSYNLKFANLIHKNAYVSRYAKLGQGNFVGANATIAPQVKLGDFNFINRNCSIGHHTILGHRNKTGPGVTISSLCKIENNNAFGSGSIIVPEISVCSRNTIGAGAVVTKDIALSGMYIGVPAKNVN